MCRLSDALGSPVCASGDGLFGFFRQLGVVWQPIGARDAARPIVIVECLDPKMNGAGFPFERMWFDNASVQQVKTGSVSLSDRRLLYLGKRTSIYAAAMSEKCGGLNRSTQHFILKRRDGVYNGSKISSRFHRGRESGIMGPLAAWGVFEGDWAGVW
jgi:hypothetical protein